MNIHIDGVFDDVSPSLPPSPLSRYVTERRGAMEACRKIRATSHLRPQTQTQIVWLLVVYVCFAVAETMSDKTFDKTQMPSREAALKGREEKMVVAGKYRTVVSLYQDNSWHGGDTWCSRLPVAHAHE